MSEAIRLQWERLAKAHRVALIPYVTAGYPSRRATLDVLELLAREGADFVELGLPFTDPLADGPVIQLSMDVALRGGMTVDDALALVREAGLDIPVIAFGYLNPILAYGIERFVNDALRAGVAGLLLTDLPRHEDTGIETTARKAGLPLIPLVAPTSSDERLASTLADAEGFVYLISRLGVTGGRTQLGERLRHDVERVRRVTRLPIAVGFGIASGEQATLVARDADGVVVGSALVERLGAGLDAAGSLMRELRAALDDATPPSR